jgi:hypothetical protein
MNTYSLTLNRTNGLQSPPLLGIPEKDLRCGVVEFLVKYEFYDIYESRKTSKQKIRTYS